MARGFNKDTATLEKGIKQPCDKCTAMRTYYENPCWLCIHNPKTPEEILESYRSEIFKERFDLYTNHRFEGRVARTVLTNKGETVETYQCGACHKPFITIKRNRTRYCPSCGSRINYEEGESHDQ